MRAIYPMDPSEIVYASWSPDEVVFDKGDGVGTLDGPALITELNTLFAVSPDLADRLYGWTPENAFPDNGLSDPLWASGQGHVAFGNDTVGATPPVTSRYRRTFAHENGHNTDGTGLQHTNRRLQGDEYGFDTLGVDPFNRTVMRKYPNADSSPDLDLFDFMRGGELEVHAWVTPDHYPMFGVTRPLARRKSLFSRPPRPHRPQKCSDNASRNRLEFTETYPCFSEIRRDNGSHVPENRESPLQKRHRQRIRPCRRGLP